MERVNRPCTRCGRGMVGKWRWQNDRELRESAKAAGLVRSGSHGLCSLCEGTDRRRRRRETEAESSARYLRSEVVAEYRMLYDPAASVAENCRQIAPRLGMRASSMERALQRAGVKPGVVAA